MYDAIGRRSRLYDTKMAHRTGILLLNSDTVSQQNENNSCFRYGIAAPHGMCHNTIDVWKLSNSLNSQSHSSTIFTSSKCNVRRGVISWRSPALAFKIISKYVLVCLRRVSGMWVRIILAMNEWYTTWLTSYARVVNKNVADSRVFRVDDTVVSFWPQAFALPCSLMLV